jgi:cytosine/adenosine deaminase-related metal-dependent hydrolase
MAQTLNSWTLTGARIALDARTSKELDLCIEAGRIGRFALPRTTRQKGNRIDLRGCLILPGLINGHDHLEFNLFPRLGNGPYPSARDWAEEIYRPDSSPLREHLRVPLDVRLLWGGTKNLLSGVTTVCHHNPYYRTCGNGFPVRVTRRYGWAHSLDFAPDIARRFRRTPRSWPFVVHLGEATDKRGEMEVFELDRRGALDSRTVLVHGVALNDAGVRRVRARAAAVVCCPSSNLFLLGTTLRGAVFDSGIPVALGTDSALTNPGDLLDELKVARRVLKLPLRRLYGMVTTEAAGVFRLRDGEGRLAQGGVADLLIVRDRGLTAAATLLSLTRKEIRLVMVGGEIRVASPHMAPRLRQQALRQLRPVVIDRCRMLVPAKIQALVRQTQSILGPVTLAGRRVHARA